MRLVAYLSPLEISEVLHDMAVKQTLHGCSFSSLNRTSQGSSDSREIPLYPSDGRQHRSQCEIPESRGARQSGRARAHETEIPSQAESGSAHETEVPSSLWSGMQAALENYLVTVSSEFSGSLK